MKIGFVVHFFDFRNDVRKVIQIISERYETVLFVRPSDVDVVKTYVPKAEIRIIQEQQKTWKNRLWDQIYRLMGKLPGSTKNYYLMEYFKISLSGTADQRKRAYSLLKLAMKLPHFLSYDRYLNSISYQAKTDIDDIDQFICFTDISDSYFFSRLLQEKKTVKVYVYSWDHPCKHMKYSQQVRYLVWHDGIRQDLIDLQHISSKNISITGASQFAYIHQFLQSSPERRTFDFDYLYFGCAIGIPQLVVQETQVIHLISERLTASQSELKLVVRPYPVLSDWSHYEALKNLPNVVFDDQFRTKDLSVGESQILEKYEKIKHAKAFLHLGTTMGLEACFIETPSLILDFPEFKKDESILSLHNFVHQFQNEKYLMQTNTPNVVRSVSELDAIIRQLTDDKGKLLDYNREVAAHIPLKSFEQFASDLINA